MATFVLVHGAIVGGWCWRWVAHGLREAGHEVHTPTMTGLGERIHLATPEVDLDTHIEDIANVLRFEDLTEVVLVGWSYGGMVVAGVADRLPERIAHVVYLDSDVPSDGDTSAPASVHAVRRELAAPMTAGAYRSTLMSTLLQLSLPGRLGWSYRPECDLGSRSGSSRTCSGPGPSRSD